MWFIAWLACIIVLSIESFLSIREAKRSRASMKRRDENIERIANALESIERK